MIEIKCRLIHGDLRTLLKYQLNKSLYDVLVLVISNWCFTFLSLALESRDICSVNARIDVKGCGVSMAMVSFKIPNARNHIGQSSVRLMERCNPNTKI